MNNNTSSAETMDLMNSRIAIGLLMAALAYGLEASAYLLTDGGSQILQWLGFAMTLLAALRIFTAIAPELWNKIKRKNKGQPEAESFVTESFHKAIIKSWAFTIGTLMIFTIFDEVIGNLDLPFKFYINGLIFIMLFSTSVTFLITTRTSEEDELSEEEL